MSGMTLKHRCRLLEDLPSELRNDIYELAVTEEGGIHIDMANVKPGVLGALALPMTCKRIYNECGPLCYRLNPVTVMFPVLKSAEEMMRQEWRVPEKHVFDKCLLHSPLASHLRELRLNLGRSEDNPIRAQNVFFCGWLDVEPSIIHLLRRGVRIHISLELSLFRERDVIHFWLSTLRQTLIDVYTCICALQDAGDEPRDQTSTIFYAWTSLLGEMVGKALSDAGDTSLDPSNFLRSLMRG